MVRVDLNSVRTKMADSVETLEYTSTYERIHGAVSIKLMNIASEKSRYWGKKNSTDNTGIVPLYQCYKFSIKMRFLLTRKRPVLI